MIPPVQIAELRKAIAKSQEEAMVSENIQDAAKEALSGLLWKVRLVWEF